MDGVRNTAPALDGLGVLSSLAPSSGCIGFWLVVNKGMSSSVIGGEKSSLMLGDVLL